MATTPKKRSKKSKVTRTASRVESLSQLKKTIATQEKTIASQAQEIREGAEQQAATSEILRLIARAPADLQSVLDAIAQNAARLCVANDALVWRTARDGLQLVSHFGSIPTVHALGTRSTQEIDRDTPAGRAVLDRQTIHVHDLVAAQVDFPRARTRGIAMGVRTTLATPLLRDGVVLGVIHTSTDGSSAFHR